ncbi:MAG: O-antigen ligase family protein [Parcubacteria group bacterium]
MPATLAAVIGKIISPLPAVAAWWVAVVLLWLVSLLLIVRALNSDPKLKKTFFVALFSLGVIESALGIMQFALQHSLGLSLLGEPVADSSTLGVAKVVAYGEKLLRPFGTFPHSNVLGGYLLVCFVALLSRFRSRSTRNPLLIQITTGLISLGIFFTYSRSSWVGFLLVVTIFLFRDGMGFLLRPALLSLGACLLLFGPSVGSRFVLSEQSAQLEVRSLGISSAIEAVKSLPLGTGIRGFIPYLVDEHPDLPAYSYQPVHNSFLLVVAEVGPFGFFLLLLSLISLTCLRKVKKMWFLPVFALLPLLFLDHYLVTLSQGLGILSLYCVLIRVPREGRGYIHNLFLNKT